MYTILAYNILEQQWAQMIIMAIASGIAGLIAYGFARLNMFIASKTKNEKVRAYSKAVLDLIESSVLSIQQTFVSTLIKNGKWDKDAQKQAFDMAFAKVKANMTAETQKILSEVYPELDKWIAQQIEAVVFNLLPHGNKEVK